MSKKKLFVAGILFEAATGLALIIDPGLVIRFLVGLDLSPGGMVLGRIAGTALLSLCIACWPGKQVTHVGRTSAVLAMFTYNLIATVYLAYVWLGLGLVGLLLIPALVEHLFFSLFFAKIWFTKDAVSAK